MNESKVQIADTERSEILKVSQFIGLSFYWINVIEKIKRKLRALAGVVMKLGYVFNCSKAKCRDLKDVRLMNVIGLNQNLKEKH